jgi:hypothetical protein
VIERGLGCGCAKQGACNFGDGFLKVGEGNELWGSGGGVGGAGRCFFEEPIRRALGDSPFSVDVGVGVDGYLVIYHCLGKGVSLFVPYYTYVRGDLAERGGVCGLVVSELDLRYNKEQEFKVWVCRLAAGGGEDRLDFLDRAEAVR